MSVHLTTIILGLSGDTLTFIGSTLLALDALRPERAFREEQRVITVRSHPALAKLTVEMDGRTLVNDEDVKLVFMHRRANKAKLGYVLLAVGFAALLVTRLLELKG
jgi:hypothetical protein